MSHSSSLFAYFNEILDLHFGTVSSVSWKMSKSNVKLSFFRSTAYCVFQITEHFEHNTPD